MRWVPMAIRRNARDLIKGIKPGTWDKYYELVDSIIPGPLRLRMPGYKIHKIADLLVAKSPHGMYDTLASHWSDPTSVVIGAREPRTDNRGSIDGPVLSTFTEEMMYLDLVTYLPDDILTKVDRASMAVSLEARVPLLDHRVVEFAWRLPLSMKLRDGQSKWILRQVLYRYVPRELLDRPKTGFAIPLDSWLRGPLREWAEELLDERRIRNDGYFNAQPIRRMWAEHLNGKHPWQYHLWDVLMFQAWLESQGCTTSAAEPADVVLIHA